MSSKVITKGTGIQTLSKTQSNIYVLHIGTDMWEINKIEIDSEKMTCDLMPFSGPGLTIYNRIKFENKKSFPKEVRSYVSQTHIFASKYETLSNQTVILNEDIFNIEIIKKGNAAKVVGITLAIALPIILLIALLAPYY